MELRRTVIANAVARVGIGPRVGVGPREIEVIASDRTVDRMGDILEPEGVRLENFRRNPIVLAQHDSDQPVARAGWIGIVGAKIMAKVVFPPEGTSERSDEYLRLCKTGVISAVSVGFLPLKVEPIKGTFGLRFIAWELLELSLVSVPANPSAVVTAKSAGDSRAPLIEAARTRLAGIKSGRNYRAYVGQQAAQAALARGRERSEIDQLCRQARLDHDRIRR
ncbi:MAG: hypothetical protein AB7S71_01425 [Dongiaceae bacterium]